MRLELYTVYFPHVASFDPWETEIALTNTSVATVRGEFKAYGPDGGSATQSVNVTLGPLQRKEITVGRFFQDPANIAYRSFVSDSGFLAGYTRDSWLQGHSPHRNARVPGQNRSLVFMVVSRRSISRLTSLEIFWSTSMIR